GIGEQGAGHRPVPGQSHRQHETGFHGHRADTSVVMQQTGVGGRGDVITALHDSAPGTGGSPPPTVVYWAAESGASTGTCNCAKRSTASASACLTPVLAMLSVFGAATGRFGSNGTDQTSGIRAARSQNSRHS